MFKQMFKINDKVQFSTEWWPLMARCNQEIGTVVELKAPHLSRPIGVRFPYVGEVTWWWPEQLELLERPPIRITVNAPA